MTGQPNATAVRHPAAGAPGSVTGRLTRRGPDVFGMYQDPSLRATGATPPG